MKTGRTLEDLAREITRQHESKHDYMASTTALKTIVADDGQVNIRLGGSTNQTFGINEVAHGQIAAHAKIPTQYYDRMRRDAPELLANNIDTWFKKYPETRMVRTLDGQVRALMSNSFRPLDNFDFANAILPVLAKRKLQVMSCEITDKRLYIKAVDEQLFRDVPVGKKMGDGGHTIFGTCAPAVIASNSEVGYGRLVLETGVYTKACTNLALWSDGGMKKIHLGARHKLLQDVENIDHLLSDRTRQKTDEVLWLQVRDVLSAAFDEKMFDTRLKKIADTAKEKITGKIEEVVEITTAKFGLNQTEGESILKHLIEGGSLTRYGLYAAVTRSAQDATDYDRATEMEYIGGKIIELPKSEWMAMAEAT